MIVYVGTSAAMRLLAEEAESAALAEYLEQARTVASDTLVASLLLHTELHCAANRRHEDIHPESVADVLSTLADGIEVHVRAELAPNLAAELAAAEQLVETARQPQTPQRSPCTRPAGVTVRDGTLFGVSHQRAQQPHSPTGRRHLHRPGPADLR